MKGSSSDGQGQVAYDRGVLVNVLVYHQRVNLRGCGCGWDALGRSHPEHVADVYEESIRARQDSS